MIRDFYAAAPNDEDETTDLLLVIAREIDRLADEDEGEDDDEG